MRRYNTKIKELVNKARLSKNPRNQFIVNQNIQMVM